VKTGCNLFLQTVFLALLLLPAAAAAENRTSAVGVLKPDGYVTVNGHPIVRTTALFPGDNIKCGPHSTAWIVRSGHVTQVPNNSEASFHDGKFRVASYKHNDRDDKEADDKERHEGDRNKCKAISPSHPKHGPHERGNHHERDCDDH
jgi:ribosomal protein L27